MGRLGQSFEDISAPSEADAEAKPPRTGRASAAEPARTERGAGVPAGERVGGAAGAKHPGLKD